MSSSPEAGKDLREEQPPSKFTDVPEEPSTSTPKDKDDTPVFRPHQFAKNTLHPDRSASGSSSSSSFVPVQDRSPPEARPQDTSSNVRNELMHIYQSIGSLSPTQIAQRRDLCFKLNAIVSDQETSSSAKDEFAQTGGFLLLVQILSSLSYAREESEHQTVTSRNDQDHAAHNADDIEERREVFQLVFSILKHVLHDGDAHKDIFQESVGWSGLTSAISISGMPSLAPQHTFAILLGLATGDLATAMQNFCSLGTGDRQSETVISIESGSWSLSLEHPEALHLIYDQLQGDPAADGQQQSHVRSICRYLIRHSLRNIVAVAKTDLPLRMLNEALAAQFAEQAQEDFSLLQEIYTRCGITDVDGKILLRAALANSEQDGRREQCMDLLTSISKAGPRHNEITFDTRPHGHSSLAFSSLRKPFPPSTACNGWSFITTLTIQSMEEARPLELLHIFDASRSCSTKLAISKHHLLYSPRPDIGPLEFKGFRFAVGKPLHFAFSHERPKGNARTSLAQIYIDGVLVEQQIAPWPSSPAASDYPIRAVIGTAPSASPSSNHIWSIGPTYLMDQCMPAECALVLKELGSTYSGNLQDSLGRFLTYQASTKVNLRLEALARELSRSSANSKQGLDRHPLVTAIAGRQGGLFQEDHFYWAIHAGCTATRPRRTSIIDNRPETIVVLNQAVTLTRDAMAASYGYAKLYGSPILNVPKSLEDVVWRHGGCALLLHSIDEASNERTFNELLELFLSSISNSWRLCEDAEKIRAYEILNVLLRRKSHFINIQTLTCILSAVGIDVKDGTHAALVNPFMYRVIVLDFELWAGTPEDVQCEHLAHLTTLMRTSKHRRFNIKRVVKMQIVKRLLFRLRDLDDATDTMFGHIIEALRTLLIASWSDAALRATTSYLATKLCESTHASQGSKAKPNSTRYATLDAQSALAGKGKTELQNIAADPNRLPLGVFDLVCTLASERPTFLSKLGQSVSIKWLLLFLHPRSDKRAAILSFELLASLLIQDRTYIGRLSSAGGWKVLERLIPRFWEEPPVIPLCFSVLFGQLRQPNTRLTQNFGSAKTIFCPQMLRVILHCFKEALTSISGGPGRLAISSQTRKVKKSRPSDTLAVESSSASSMDKQRHMRKRSNSMNIDTQSLAASFRANSHHALVQDITVLMHTHADRSIAFRDALFTPLTLRAAMEALEPYVEIACMSTSGMDELTAPEKACKDLLTKLAQLSTESMLLTGSTDIVATLIAAIPPRDLAQQGAFKFALISRILSSIRTQLSDEKQVEPEGFVALAQFIEQASHDILHGSTLEDILFEAITDLLCRVVKLENFPRQPQPSTEGNAHLQLSLAAGTLHGSLNRVALYSLSKTSDIAKTFERLLHHQSLFLGSNTDIAFVQCLANRAIHFLSSEDETLKQCSWNILKLIVLSQPRVAAQLLSSGKRVDDVLEADLTTVDTPELFAGPDPSEDSPLPFGSVWQGFLESAEALRTATHLQRIAQLRQLLDQSDARERAVASTERRMIAWHQELCTAEASRFSKHKIDVQELQQSASLELRSSVRDLQRNRGILASQDLPKECWQLDPIEGPRRMRKRLREQPRAAEMEELSTDDGVEEQDASQMPAEDANGHGDVWGSGDGQLSDEPEAALASDDVGEIADASLPPVTDTGDDSSKLVSNDAFVELSRSHDVQADHDDHEYKFRKVLRSLERGDRVEGVVNASRVVGIDCRAALCITGKLCLYLVDDYFQRTNGELVNVWQAPEAERDAHVLAALSSDSNQPSALITELEGSGQTRKWAWSALRRVHRRQFLHRKTALELFFADGQSCLLVLPTTGEANALYTLFASRCRAAITGAEQMRDGIREPASSSAEGTRNGGFSAKLGAVLGRQNAGVITEAWRQRKISNYDYLMKLNTLAGRSFNDLSQYPVFPWVIADYTSECLDLNNPDTFRDLRRPMGALTPERQKQFEERYESLVEIGEAPFHYGTHFSTAATTAGYLIRLRPFDKLLMALQGGSFDLAERTFASIEKAWKSASELSRGDVRELTPEFFYLPDFLVNTNQFDFGFTQAGAKIDSVELPPWARGDPLVFVQKNREALESEHVSANLHHWIDLVFGYRQSGPEAVKAINVFHPLSYAGEVDLEGIQDPNERRAACQTVWNFGVCPTRLFERPHVARNDEDVTLALGTTPWMAIESIAPLRTLKAACRFIYADPPEKAYASPADYLILPRLGVSLSSGHLDGSIRMSKSGDPARPIVITEQAGIERILCMTQAGPAVIMTGCRDGLVLLWKVDAPNCELNLESALRGHSEQVTCLASSQNWRVAVSGSDDGTAIVWDINRATMVRTLRGHAAAVQHVAIDDEEGYIATSAGQGIFLWSINGDLLAKVVAGSRLSESVTCLSFVATDVHRGGRLALLLTGHRGKVVAWSCEYQGDTGADGDTLPWSLRPFHIFEHRDRLSVLSDQVQSNVTALHVAGTKDGQCGRYLFTGDDQGHLNVWTLPGDAFVLPDTFTNRCMGCDKKFGVLDARRGCRGCGGMFCSACAEPLSKSMSASTVGSSGVAAELRGMRFCSGCKDVCLAVQ
ncbi:unnamed protein product [Sympodiomycopsis kandeliae]